jgi:hypothetical protein
MTSFLSDSLPSVTARLLLALWLLSLSPAAQAAEPPPPPPAATQALPESVALPSTRAREPLPEPKAVKVRIDGEYEARQSFLTPLPLTPIDESPASLDQTSRLFHWLRLRGLVLLGTRAELRAEADLPRGMIYGREPDAIPDNGSDFDRVQPVRVQPRMLRLTLRDRLGEVTFGHTTTQLGMGLVDADGDQPRWFGTPDRPATYERLELLSGSATSILRVGASGDLLFDDGRISLANGDDAWRAGLNVRFAPNTRVHSQLLARYEALAKKNGLGGARQFLVDLSGGFRSPIAGRNGELFAEYEAAYRVGSVSEPTAFGASGDDQALAALAFAARAGVALERFENFRRFAHVVASVEWGIASGDADPTDDELHRFVMNANHGVGLILFSEILRFKTSRAQALLERAASASGRARWQGLATGGGVAGASYLNPVLLVRPAPDLTLKLGAVVASTTTSVVDPSALADEGEATRARKNFDGGSPLGRALGSELDVGGELVVPLDAPMLLRLSVEGAVAFPGSAFADAAGHGLGTQAITTCGLGLTF